MKFFGQKKDKEEMSQPTDDQLQGQDKPARTDLAWLLGLATLFVTLILALGIFFAGRRVYRNITRDDNQTAVTSEQESADSGEEEESPETDEGESPETPTPIPTPPPFTPPVTGPSTGNLLNTGPDSNN